MIKESEYKAALKIVEAYRQQEYLKNNQPNKVKLNAWGIEMSDKKYRPAHKLEGVILKKELAGVNDYMVEVLWSNGKQEWLHESHLTEI